MLLSVFHRTLGGRVTLVELRPAEAAAAITCCPWEWAADQKAFAPWPASRVRGDPVYPLSLADTAQPSANSIWR